MISWHFCLCPCCPLAQQQEQEDHKGEGRTGPLSSLQQKMCAPLSGKCLWKSSESIAAAVNSNYQVLWAASDSAGHQRASSEDSCGSVRRWGQRKRDGHVLLRLGAAGDAGLCGSVAVRFNHNYLTTVVDHVHCSAACRELRAGPVGDLCSPGCWWHGVQTLWHSAGPVQWYQAGSHLHVCLPRCGHSGNPGGYTWTLPGEQL